MKATILYAFASGSCGVSLGKVSPLASATLIVSGLVALGFVGIETGQKIGLLEEREDER